MPTSLSGVQGGALPVHHPSISRPPPGYPAPRWGQGRRRAPYRAGWSYRSPWSHGSDLKPCQGWLSSRACGPRGARPQPHSDRGAAW